MLIEQINIPLPNLVSEVLTDGDFGSKAIITTGDITGGDVFCNGLNFIDSLNAFDVIQNQYAVTTTTGDYIRTNLTIPTGPWTMCFWNYYTEVAQYDTAAASTGDHNTGTPGFMFMFDNSTPKKQRIFANGTGVTALAGQSAGEWVHYAATYDETTLRFYRDGVLQGSVAASYTGSGKHIGIGNANSDATNWDGIRSCKAFISDVMVFDVEVGGTEIASIVALGRAAGSYGGASAGDLTGHWPLDEGSTDDDVGVNDGILQNIAYVADTDLILNSFEAFEIENGNANYLKMQIGLWGKNRIISDLDLRIYTGSLTSQFILSDDGTIEMGEGNVDISNGNLDVGTGTVDALGFKDNGVAGITDTFVNGDGDTVTVSGGIITSIV